MTLSLRTFGYAAMLAAVFTVILSSGGSAHAQQIPDPGQLLSPEQLDDMVAPIALYPDPLISQILVASTYPLEIVEATQWLQRNPNVQGAALSQAALNQDWDPSIQALVVFPDVLKFLMEDISWTTNVGNAVLAQEGDVMDAIQRMRDRAAQSGKLLTTPEQQVIQYVDAGQPVYEILPVNPTVIYVPVYDPFYIWGSAHYYPYPRWYYPPRANHIYFNSGIYIDAYYGSGWYGSAWSGPSYTVWNNWGWRPAWNTRTVVVNNVFIDNHNFNTGRPRNVNVATTTSWSHDSTHRRGVVYPTSAPYDRYRGDNRNVSRPQQAAGPARTVPAQASTWNGGSNTSTARPANQSTERPTSRDTRPDGRPDQRQGSRPDASPAVRQPAGQDTRIAGRDSTPNSQNRENRGSNSAQPVRSTSAAPASATPSGPAQELSWSRGSTSRVPTVSNAQAPATTRQVGPAQDQNRTRSTASQPQASAPNPMPMNTTRQAGQPQDQNRTRNAAPQSQASAPNPTPMNTTRQAGQPQDQNRTRNAAPQLQASVSNPVNVSRQAAAAHEQPQSYRAAQGDPAYIRQTQLSPNSAASIARTPTPNTVRESPSSSRAAEMRSVPQQQSRQTASTPVYSSASRQGSPERSVAAESRQAPAQSASPASNGSSRSSHGGSVNSSSSNGSSSQGGNARGRR